MNHALEATAPICRKRLDYNAKLSPRLGTLPPPCPHPFCVYNSKVPNGVRFQRLIFLRESGSSETLEDSSAPLFCGNKDSSATPEDSSAAFLRENRSSVAPQDSSGLLKDSSAQTLSVKKLLLEWDTDWPVVIQLEVIIFRCTTHH